MVVCYRYNTYQVECKASGSFFSIQFELFIFWSAEHHNREEVDESQPPPPTENQEVKRSLKKKMKHQEVNTEYNSSFSFEQLAARVKDCPQLQVIQATTESNTNHTIKTIPVAELEKQLKQPVEVKIDSPPQVNVQRRLFEMDKSSRSDLMKRVYFYLRDKYLK